MTAKFKQIIERLDAFVTFKADKSMSDDDFIANIEAVNLLINLHDDLGLDRKVLRRRMNDLYSEFSRRIYGKKDIQLAVSLIKTLNDFIYGRENDRGPQRWRDTLVEMCCKVIDAYRKNPLIGITDYLYALDTVCRVEDNNRRGINSAEQLRAKASPLLPDKIIEYQEAIAALLDDIDNVPLAEKIRRVGAYERAKHIFVSDNWEKWVEAREQLKNENARSMDDETLLLWCEVTDQYPAIELKKRSDNSKQMMVDYLRSQIISEFAKQDRLKKQRKLAKGLKTLNDDIIADIIPIKIDAEMSVSTLFALETIFYLRLQLAQISDDDKMSVYESLYLNRFEKIANALKKKYPTAESLNEKIEILERLSVIGGMIHSNHYDFAIEEAAKLKSPTFVGRDGEGLTYSQKLRLDWIPSITSENDSEIVERILNAPSLAGRDGERLTSFDMETLALISDCVTSSEREAIFNRFTELTNAAIASKDEKALSSLLALAAYWNSIPSLRKKIKALSDKAQFLTPNSSLLIEFRLNEIAAEIYTRIDAITGKYADKIPIPA